MGRPLRKDVFGTDAIGTYVSNTGVRISFYDASLRTDGVIIKQRGAKSFVVTQVGNIGDTSSGKYVTAKLVSTTPTAYGEMLLVGYTTPAEVDANAVPLAKITKRVATDFNGVRYNWFLQNDSSADYIVLTPIA